MPADPAKKVLLNRTRAGLGPGRKGAFLAVNRANCLEKLHKTVGKILGSGRAGTVFQACQRRGGCERTVVKFQILGRDPTPLRLESIAHEVALQRKAAEAGVAPRILSEFMCQTTVLGQYIHVLVMPRLYPVVGQSFTAAAIRTFWRSLAALHRLGIYHGDIFSGNVLTPKNRFKIVLSDYGEARQVENSSIRADLRSRDVYQSILMFIRAGIPVPPEQRAALRSADLRSIDRATAKKPGIFAPLGRGKSYIWRKR